MKDSKTLLARHLLLSFMLQVLVILLIALPALEPYRQQLATLTNTPRSIQWMPLLGLLLVAHIFILRRITAQLVSPVQELVNQTKLGTASIAFKKKSQNTEEDHLKHFIESQALRSTELELEVGRLEEELQQTAESAAMPPEEIESLREHLRLASELAERRSKELEEAREVARRSDKDAVFLRRELKKRESELAEAREETRLSQASEDASPLSSLLIERLKNPLSLINNLSWRLSRSWAETPPAQVREGLEEICKQSEEQLELLKKYSAESAAAQEDAREAR